MLADAEPGLRPLLDGCKQNRENWEKLQEEHDKLSKTKPREEHFLDEFLYNCQIVG